MSQSDYGLLLPSEYLITYTTINRMPLNSQFIITYPATVRPPDVLDICSIDYKGVRYNLTGCIVDKPNLTIYVTEGFDVEVEKGTELVIRLGLIITPIS